MTARLFFRRRFSDRPSNFCEHLCESQDFPREIAKAWHRLLPQQLELQNQERRKAEQRLDRDAHQLKRRRDEMELTSLPT